MKSSIYLDHAAATPLDAQALVAMTPYFSELFYNPSAVYLAAQNVRTAVEKARSDIAQVFDVRKNEVIFTAGATEANNLAIHGVMTRYPVANIVVSAVEHDSVMAVAGTYNVRKAPVDASGVIHLDSLKKQIDDNTVLVSVMLANNEIGTVQPLVLISKILSTVRKERQHAGNALPIYLHCDAAQALNYLPVLPNKLGVDLLSINGGKIYGPKQSGLLFVKTGVELAPLIFGGGQERGLRSGTENVPAIIGLATAMQKAVALRISEAQRLKKLQAKLESDLKKSVPALAVTAELASRLPNIVHVTVSGFDNERLMMELDERGIACAVGSACSASSDEPSHVLKAIGMTAEQAQTSLRFSMGRSTTEADITELVTALVELTNA